MSGRSRSGGNAGNGHYTYCCAVLKGLQSIFMTVHHLGIVEYNNSVRLSDVFTGRMPFLPPTNSVKALKALGGVVGVGAPLVWLGWRPPGLPVPLPPLSSPAP